jgi:hypothetical protein
MTNYERIQIDKAFCASVLFRAEEGAYELWIAGEWRESRGCNMEYGFAKAKGIPVEFVGGGD